MAYGAEVRSINNGIEAAKDVLNDLNNENLVEAVFGDAIRNAINMLEEAESEASYIDDQPDQDDLDAHEIYRNAYRIDDLIDELEEKSNEIRELASEVRTNTRDYA